VVHKLFLKSGVALMALTGLSLSLPAVADSHAKPVVRQVSKTFDEQSRQAAARTVGVVQTGTTDAQYTSQGHDVDQVVAQTAALSSEPVIACPKGPVGSPEWQQLPEDLRRNAIPGQCFSRLLTSPKVETYRERVVVKPERTETRAVAEVIELVEEKVLVKPERVERRVVPAVVHKEMVTEIVRPASFREERIPARYETRVEHIMVKDARREWVRREGVPTEAPLLTPVEHAPVRYRQDGTLQWPGKSQPLPVSRETSDYIEHNDGQDVWCLKMVPGVYEDRQSRVEIEPERVRRVEVPAETRRVRREVIDTPERVEEVVIPAVYETRKVRRVAQPARTEAYTVPAVYDDVTQQRVTGQPEPVWREVICGKNTSTAKIMEVQRALAARGYQPGPIDGQLGKQTVSAMQKFQADNGLPQGQPSVEAVKLLGVPLIPLAK
jgi:peptidoglycan hydrolase-like protein with peptidoglycan-binding domain